MKYDKFFKLAKEAGIEDAELHIHQSHTLSMSLFHGEIDKYSDENGFSISARGIVNGKCGAASCDVWSNEKAEFLVREIVANAKVIENKDPVFIFPGSEKYHKVNTYNKELGNVPSEVKLEKLFALEKKIKEADERIVEIQMVGFDETTSSSTIMNSKGLKLSQKVNYFLYYGGAVAKQGEQVKSGFELFLDNDFNKFDVDVLAKKIATSVTEQLGGEACDTGSYRAVLSPDVVNSLMSCYISSAIAEEVQKKSSLFIGKLNQKVASNKVTVEDRPLFKSVFASWFDSEGVATYNKPIIKNGVLKTYLYNLTTAAKDGVQSTGNASGAGSEVGTAPMFLYMKPGKKSQEELFKEVGNGVYITEVSGLHAGMNAQSGNFSLQSTGFLIKDGKKDRPLDIITVSGNLVEIFNGVLEVGSDSKLFAGGASFPSVTIKKIAVSGK